MNEKKQKKNKKKKGSDFIIIIVLVIAVAIFVFAGYNLLRIFLEYKKANDIYNNIAQEVVEERDADPQAADPVNEISSDTPVCPISVDFDTLLSKNSDVCGWIYVEAIPSINYPIAHGEDDAYYLHMTVDKTYNFAGTIFMEYQNSADFSDPNTILYGHNMKNGSMFGSLKKFVNDDSVYAQSKYFWILTPQYDLRYEILAAYTTGVSSETYTIFKGPCQEFEDYLQYIKGESKLQTDISGEQLTMNDKVVTLSTCTGDSSTRFVVQGLLVDSVPAA